MTTALDTNVLLDVFFATSRYHRRSAEALKLAYDSEALCISEVVYAELGPCFPEQEELEEALRELGVSVVLTDRAAAWRAGRAWAEYRKRGGPKHRLLADMLIGAHASIHADCLLTRDRGFYHSYFTELEVREP